MKVILWASIFVVAVLSGCVRSTDGNSIHRQHCNAHGVTLVFDGENVGGKIFPGTIYLENRANQKTIFTPRDPVSVQQSAFVIKSVWSPNADWLLLPDGRFEGFAAFRASDLPSAGARATNALHIGVCDVTGIRWWHEFVRWKSPSVFEFRAGLSGHLTAFDCDLSTGIVMLSDEAQIDFSQLPK